MNQHYTRLALAVCVGVLISVVQAGSFDADYQRIQIANQSGDLSDLTQISQLLNHNSSAHQDAEADYIAAYADYRIACVGQYDVKANGQAINAALDRAEVRLLRLGNEDSSYRADALALLSSVYGMKIGMSPVKGPVLGIKAGSAAGQALKLAPNSGHVQLALGINKLFTPALFGGSTSEAMAAFDRAIVLLTDKHIEAGNWGLDDALIWKGIALQGQGDKDGARTSFTQALQVAPEHSWAKHLLAQLDKAG